MDTAAMEAEIAQHVAWWNATPQPARLLLLQTALPADTATFVAHSNALEGVPTLSAEDTATMVLGLSHSHSPHSNLALLAARNTYTAHRLAHAFRSQRSAAGGAPADELLWHLPEVLAVHRELMRGLHPRAGRLRTSNVQPADRAAPYPPFTTVPSTVMSLFDACNAHTLRVFEGDEGLGGSAGWAAGARVDEGFGDWGGALDKDGAVQEGECQKLLSAPPPAPAARDIDARAIGPVARLAAWLAAHLLEVHPFADGNGRLARILADALLAAVHPAPVALVPEGCSLQEARVRYLGALREVPPWDAQGSTGWALRPTALTDLVLGSLVASWRRLKGQSSGGGGGGGGGGPFLGVLALSLRSQPAQRRVRYAALGHCARLPTPPTLQALQAEADALPLPLSRVAQPPAALTSEMVAHAPTGRLEDGWLHLIWLP